MAAGILCLLVVPVNKFITQDSPRSLCLFLGDHNCLLQMIRCFKRRINITRIQNNSMVSYTFSTCFEEQLRTICAIRQEFLCASIVSPLFFVLKAVSSNVIFCFESRIE